LTSKRKSNLRTAFHRTGERRFSGYVVDTNNLDRRFTVEILVDGYPIDVIRSDAYVHQLVTENVGDGYYGFSYALSDAAVSDSAVVEARLANLGTVVGAPILLSQPSADAAPSFKRGTLKWLGGLRFSGAIAGDQEQATANVLVDGTLVTRVRATKWSHVGTSEADARAIRMFDFYLPEKFADGNAHQLTMVDEAGEDIAGGPLAFLAYADGLREAVAAHGLSEQEGLRAQLLDALLPMSVPFSEYQYWRERFPIPLGPPAALTGAVIMVGTGATEDTLESLNEQTHDDWIAASLPQGDSPFGLDPKLMQEFLNGDGADCHFVVFAPAGTLFAASALQRIAAAFAELADAQVIYGDLDLPSSDGSVWPLAFPAFDYERMLEQGYCAQVFAMRRGTTERLLAAGVSNLYRLFNAFLDDDTSAAAGILHLPGPLALLPQFDRAVAAKALTAATSEHLRRKGQRAETKPHPAGILPATRISRAHDHASITIIIPTRNRQQLLRSCIGSIRLAAERARAEILIVDSDSSDPETLDYLKEIDGRVATILRVPGDFNFPLLNNYAVEATNAEIICLLNNGIKALDETWLDEMVSRLAQPDVAAVGALLVWPSGVVQHGGVVLGPSFSAAHTFNDRIDSDVGYGDLLRVAHECSAVTAACMVTRRRDYVSVGGMDEVQFPVNFNDVDYCLKLRADGKRIVFTPHAKLYHLESASLSSDVRPDQERRFQRELQNLRAKWGHVLAADPYYSPILSRDPIPYSGLAWPPGPMEPRFNGQPAAIQIPLGF
jgi:GT2 family glycosyltransferase